MDNKAIRLGNVNHLVRLCGSVDAFAHQIERDPGQVSQWRSGKPIGDRLARDIEARLGKERGWLDIPHWDEALKDDFAAQRQKLTIGHRQDLAEPGLGAASASQPVGLNLAKLESAVEYVIGMYRHMGVPFDVRGIAKLTVGVYDYLASEEPTNIVELGDWLKRQVQRGERDVGQGETGSTDTDVHGRTRRKTGT